MRTIINSTRLLCLAIAGILLFSCSDNFDELETSKAAEAVVNPLHPSLIVGPEKPIDIADPSFKSYLLRKIGKQQHENVTNWDAFRITEIDCSNMSPKIKSMQGIEHFINLTYLNCRNNSIESLELIYLSKLQTLICNGNRITSLDLRYLSKLQTLICSGNRIKSLDLSRFSGLQTLICSRNDLESLDVSYNSELVYLDCNYQSYAFYLNTQRVISPPSIKFAYSMTSLKLGTLKELLFLDCSRTGISELTVKSCYKLKELYCTNTNIKTIHLNQMHTLEYVDLSNNELESFYPPNVYTLGVADANLRTLNVSNNKLTKFLIFDRFPYLESIDCTNNAPLQLVQLAQGSKTIVKKDPHTQIYYFAPKPPNPWES